jgi:hypothetical protein
MTNKYVTIDLNAEDRCVIVHCGNEIQLNHECKLPDGEWEIYYQVLIWNYEIDAAYKLIHPEAS